MAKIPNGFNSFVFAVKERFSLMHNKAKKLLIKFGSASDEMVKEDRFIVIPGIKGNAPKEISEKI